MRIPSMNAARFGLNQSEIKPGVHVRFPVGAEHTILEVSEKPNAKGYYHVKVAPTQTPSHVRPMVQDVFLAFKEGHPTLENWDKATVVH